MTELPSYLTGILTILLATSFVRFATVLTIFRLGIGLKGITFGLITAALSFALSFAVLSVQLPQLSFDVFHPESFSSMNVEKELRPLVEKHTDAQMLAHVVEASSKIQSPPAQGEKISPPKFSVVLSAFILSELKIAFQLGLLLLIPFVIIDLLAANILAVLGINHLSAESVSLPLKLLVFFGVDGWALLTHKLILSVGV